MAKKYNIDNIDNIDNIYNIKYLEEKLKLVESDIDNSKNIDELKKVKEKIKKEIERILKFEEYLEILISVGGA